LESSGRPTNSVSPDRLQGPFFSSPPWQKSISPGPPFLMDFFQTNLFSLDMDLNRPRELIFPTRFLTVKVFLFSIESFLIFLVSPPSESFFFLFSGDTNGRSPDVLGFLSST